MKYFIYVFFICIFSTTLVAQQQFVKIIDFDNKPQYANEILSIGNTFLISYSEICVDQTGQLIESCCGVLKSNSKFELIDSLKLRSFSIGPNSLKFDNINESISLSGEDYFKHDYPHHFNLKQFNCNNFSELGMAIIKHPDENQKNYFQKIFENQYESFFVGCSSKNINDDKIKTIIFKVTDNKYDSAVIIDFGLNTLSWSSIIDFRDLLTVTLSSNDVGGYNKIHIVKFDEDLNKVWHWTAENVDYIQKPYICELHDARLVVTVSDPVAPKIASLEAINPDKSRSWKYRFPDISGKIQRRVYRIKTLKNGDIVGMGSYGNNSLILDARIPEIPYIFRISSEGKLLWEKAFYRTRPVVDHCIGSIHDVTEAENGDLIAVGRIDNYLEYDPVVFQGRPDPDILIIRMDANGCIDPKCETITKIESTVSTTQHNETAGYTAFFFPNPSDGSMELMNHTVVTSVSVFDLNGSLVFIQADPGRSLDLTGLPPGLYIAHLTLVNGMVIKQKIVLQ